MLRYACSVSSSFCSICGWQKWVRGDTTWSITWQKEIESPRQGIEPWSPAWQAGILATILSRNITLNVARLELTTFGSGIRCSTNWATHPYTIPTHCILHIPLASTLTLIMLDMPWILIGQQMTCTKKSGGLQTAPGTRTRSLDIRSVTRCHCARAAMIHHAPTCIISTSILYHHQWYSSIVPTIIYQGRLP